MYVKIEKDPNSGSNDGKIVKEGRCPKNLILENGTTLFDFDTKHSEETKNQYGWFKVIDEKPVVESWQTYRPTEIVLVEGVPTQQYEVITPTLDEYKTNKLKELNNYVKPKFPSLEKQLNAQSKKPPKSYDTEKIDKILANAKFWKDYHDDKEIEILAFTTHQEVLDFDFRTDEDKLLDEEMI